MIWVLELGFISDWLCEMNFDRTLRNHPVIVYCNDDIIERIVVGLFERCVYFFIERICF